MAISAPMTILVLPPMAAAASARMIVQETAWDRSPGDARSAESDERDHIKVAKGCGLATHVNAVKG